MGNNKRSNKKNKNRKNKLILTTIFILGFMIFIYPIVSNVVHSMGQTRVIDDYKKDVGKMPKKEKEKQVKKAKKYNESLKDTGVKINDPFAENQENIEGSLSYLSLLNIGETMANLEIPNIGVNLPIYHGTSEPVLQKGVGHIEGTSLPIGGIGTHTVLTAHRGLPSSRLFRDLNKLDKGDKFYIHSIEETIAYEVDEINVVLPHETEKIAIDPDKDYATLLTCEPYMINTHRLLVRGRRIPYDGVDNLQDKINKDIKAETNLFYKHRDKIILIGIFLVVILTIFINKRKILSAKSRI